MDAIVTARAGGVPLQALAEVFDRLEWILADPRPIGLVKMQWALGLDPVRVEIALLMKEAFLADNEEELRIILSQVISNHPHLLAVCQQVMNDWFTNEQLLGRSGAIGG